MNRFFVDTFYWIALANSRDQWHGQAKTFDDALDMDMDRLYTTDEVLTEFLTFYSDGLPHARRQATLYARHILANASVVVLPNASLVLGRLDPLQGASGQGI